MSQGSINMKDIPVVWGHVKEPQILAHVIERFLQENGLDNCYAARSGKELKFRCSKRRGNRVNWVLRELYHHEPLLIV